MSKPDTVEYAPAVLRSLHVLVPSGSTQADLALELGLTAWMHASGTDIEDALDQMWRMRQAVLEAGALDPVIEPIPLVGSSSRLDLLNLAIYLGNLVERAATNRGFDRDTIVAEALDRPVLRHLTVAAPRVRALRSS
ncbi:MAG TPA: hypothetical protein VHW93_01965 [Acidimicrobiales bacterium]|nr:hypothetical protein [Acidimicrobiales bacterium]